MRCFPMAERERRFKHLSMNDRLRIERMLKEGYTKQAIADAVRVSIRTIFREIRRGLCVQRTSEWIEREVYCADVAQLRYEQYLRAKGPHLKISNDHAYAAFLETKIADERLSPEAALIEAAAADLFKTRISRWTLYSYIDKGVFLRITNKCLPYKAKKRTSHRKVRVAARVAPGDSIESRPKEILSRDEFGHWEMDSVVGKKTTRKRLLVLTERKTRHELIFLLNNGKTDSVVAAIDALETRMGSAWFRAVFRSITVDNGSEFADCAGIQRSIGKDARTHVYYCHPYSSYERGSNENNNRMIRRWLPKGSDFTPLTSDDVEGIESWMNNYPRKILGNHCSRDLFEAELASLGLDCLYTSVS